MQYQNAMLKMQCHNAMQKCNAKIQCINAIPKCYAKMKCQNAMPNTLKEEALEPMLKESQVSNSQCKQKHDVIQEGGKQGKNSGTWGGGGANSTGMPQISKSPKQIA